MDDYQIRVTLHWAEKGDDPVHHTCPKDDGGETKYVVKDILEFKVDYNTDNGQYKIRLLIHWDGRDDPVHHTWELEDNVKIGAPNSLDRFWNNSNRALRQASITVNQGPMVAWLLYSSRRPNVTLPQALIDFLHNAEARWLTPLSHKNTYNLDKYPELIREYVVKKEEE